eukprot:4548679-Amphidinium_carterae.1
MEVVHSLLTCYFVLHSGIVANLCVTPLTSSRLLQQCVWPEHYGGKFRVLALGGTILHPHGNLLRFGCAV